MKKPVRLRSPFESIEAPRPRRARPRRAVTRAELEPLRRTVRALRDGLLTPDASPGELVNGFVATTRAGPLVRASDPWRDEPLDTAIRRAFPGPVELQGWLRLEACALVHGTFSSDGWSGAALYFDDLDLGVLVRWRVGRHGEVEGKVDVARLRARVIGFPTPSARSRSN